MNFRRSCLISFDWKFMPLTPGVKQPQNVIEDRMQRQFWRRSPAAHQKVGQDKLLELRVGHTRRNPLPALTLCHFYDPKQSDFSLFD